MGVVKNKTQFLILQQLLALKPWIKYPQPYVDVCHIVAAFNKQGQVDQQAITYIIAALKDAYANKHDGSLLSVYKRPMVPRI